nr:hypothetical protein [Tanacetum cinerariifolium]
MQTQTSNTLHNAIMEADSKDLDACLNACEMWKAIERLKQEWQRFVTLVKQSQELKNVSYHKLYDILKQHQHEVNEIRAEKIACVANPLALVAQQQQVYHPQTHPTYYNQHSSTRTHQVATRKREKAIVNSPQPIYDQEPSMVDDDDDETSKEKEIDKFMALISLSGTVAGARETVGSSMVQKSGIQCYNCKEYGHVARECQKPKRAKDAAYHIEKMLLCKLEEAGIQLNAEQSDWKDDTDDESDDQELEAHYMYMAKLQQVSPDAVDSRPIFDTEPEQKKSGIQCYNCKEYGHVARECPKPKRAKDAVYHLAGARDTVGSSMVQKSGIQCYNCKEYGYVARECQKPKRAKDAAYHREKMLL